LEGDDEAMDSSLIQQAQTVYVSELPPTTAAVSSHRLQNFRWTAGALKQESGLGMFSIVLSSRFIQVWGQIF